MWRPNDIFAPTADTPKGFLHPLIRGDFPMQNTEKKSKKFVVLATYVVAVLCLLAGLFLPFFNGKGILAFQLPDAFKCLLNKGNPDAKYAFTLPYQINLFGIESLKFDFMALVVVLYAAVTALALLAFVPVAFSVRKEGKAAKKFYYVIEVAALIILSIYFIAAGFMFTDNKLATAGESLPFAQLNGLGLNMVAPLGGTAVALLALCALDKGKSSAIKIVLFILSAISFLALFDFAVALSKQEQFAAFTDKISSGLVGEFSGVAFISALFTGKFTEPLLSNADVTHKTLDALSKILPAIVLLNLFIDIAKLATGKDGKAGRIFDIARYGLETATAAAVLITALNAKEKLGLMLIVILAVAAIRLAIVIIRFVIGVRKKPDNARTIDENEVIDIDDDIQPAIADEPIFDGYSVEEPAQKLYDDGYVSPEEDEYVATENEYVQPVEEPVTEPAEEPEEQPEEEPTAAEEPVTEPEQTEKTATAETVEEEEEITKFYEPDEDTSYLLPVEQPVAEEPEDEPTEVEEPVAEPEEVTAVEPIETAEEPEDEEFVQKPYREEIKPYNPYEHHNNPFRAYEQSSQPVQPYNPYAQQSQKPAQPVYEQKPAERPAPVFEQKPVPAYKPQPTERPQPVRPRPIIQEFKPVPPVSEQPKEPQVYTIDTIYAGPTDDFIRKLSNDERIEFARTFIEKNRGDLGSIPDYKVGGDNKKFFSVAFIYLGRIRGLVSDGLLNKMYKELNLL